MRRERSFAATRKRSKYKNVPKDFAGITYHSKKEAKYARDLEVRRKAGEIEKWERQVKVELYAWGCHICNYYVDFRVTYPDGDIEYVEVKGFETDVWRLKWKLFEAQMRAEHPEILLVIVR